MSLNGISWFPDRQVLKMLDEKEQKNKLFYDNDDSDYEISDYAESEIADSDYELDVEMFVYNLFK